MKYWKTYAESQLTEDDLAELDIEGYKLEETRKDGSKVYHASGRCVCPKCGGDGEYHAPSNWTRKETKFGRNVEVKWCFDCNGTGKVYYSRYILVESEKAIATREKREATKKAKTLKAIDELIVACLGEVGTLDGFKEYAKAQESSFFMDLKAMLEYGNEVPNENYVKACVKWYAKSLEPKEEPKSKYLGEVGERIVFKVQTAKALWHSSYGYLQSSTTYAIVDDKGNHIKWSSSHYVAEGATYKATIKSLEEYKGVKQTVVTRGQIVEGGEAYD